MRQLALLILMISSTSGLFAQATFKFYNGTSEVKLPNHEEYIALTISGESAKILYQKLEKNNMSGIGCIHHASADKYFCTLTLTKEGGVIP
jgi:hypothetical protein